MRSLHTIVRLAFAACGVLLLNATTARSAPPPNIVLIFVDDHGWNGTSVQMDPDIPGSRSDFYQTANIERLANEGMRFSSAYSAAAVCSPTRAALATGKSPAQLQYNDIRYSGTVRGFSGHPLTPPQVARLDSTAHVGLAQRVKDAHEDYATALIGKWHVEGGTPQQLGFDYWDEVTGSTPQDPRTVFSKTNAAIDFMTDRVAEDKPFFLELSHIALHSPILPTADSLEKYSNLPTGTIHRSVPYAAYVEDLDNGVGQLLDSIDSLGIADNTYVIYASDNGSANHESNNGVLSGGKKSIFEGGIRTPLIVRGPSIDAGSVSRVPVTTVDLYSTISDLAGNDQPLPQGVEGASLAPLLFNGGELPAGMDYLERTHAQDGALYFLAPSNIATGPVYRLRPMAAVRKGDFKLVRIFGENGQDDEHLLFDLSQNLSEAEDSANSMNLADSLPHVTAELVDLLDNWIDSADVSLPYDVAAPVSLDWSGHTSRSNADVWRSVNDVDQKFRESWDITAGPEFVAVNSSFGGAPSQALVFDGDQTALRQFFHVSNGGERYASRRFPTGQADFDRSVSFEFWLKLDDLDNSHLVFESGLPEQGLSLSIGDSDGDGNNDDARFRVVGLSGESLTVTGDTSQLANLQSDFVQVVVVLDDSPDDRNASLYVNGLLSAREYGLSGDEQSLYWDGFIQDFAAASLGAMAIEEVGGAAGEGDLPFADFGLRGQLARFAFHNFALDPQAIFDSYLSMVQSEIAGDFNRDGRVDAADYTVWRDSLGTVVGTSTADANGDGFVDHLDFDIWRRSFGASTMASLNAELVPEPQTALLLTLIVCVGTVRQVLGGTGVCQLRATD